MGPEMPRDLFPGKDPRIDPRFTHKRDMRVGFAIGMVLQATVAWAQGFTPDAAGHVSTPVGTTNITIIDGFYALCASTPELLVSVTVPSSVVEIGDSTFYNCSSLTKVELTGNLTIGPRAFYGCSSLISISSLQAVSALGESAFQGCSSLPAVALSTNLTVLPSGVFGGCSSLTAFEAPGLVAIGDYAFAGCGFTAINLPATLREIGTGAFAACRNLLEFEMPTRVTSIGGYVLSGCDSLLKEPALPSGWCESVGSSSSDCYGPDDVSSQFLAGTRFVTTPCDRHTLSIWFLRDYGVNATWTDSWTMAELVACLQDIELEPERRDSTLQTALKQWGEVRGRVSRW